MNTAQLYQHFLDHPSVTIDSRKVKAGDIFVALRGEKVDGNRFAADALARGAAFAVVDRPELAADERFLLVADSLQALQELGRHHRRQFEIPVIAIAGSNGKTTTKELIAGVLSRRYRTHFTPGNLNNHIGLPLTLLAMPHDTEVAVIELGANHQGENAMLCALCEPTHGLVTNVGKDHLEGFGGFEGVKKANAELFHYLAEHGGMAFVNRDEPFLQEMAAGVPKKLCYYSSRTAPQEDYEVQLLATHPFVRFAFRTEKNLCLEGDSRLLGRHNFANIMTAVALGRYFKVPSVAIREAIGAYEPRNNRSQLIRRGTTLIFLDAYNANPSSMEAALEAFAAIDDRRKIAILGDMLELGDAAESEHRSIARLALRLDLNRIILVGPAFAPVARELNLEHYPTVEDLRPWFQAQDFSDTSIMIKGSRGIGLEKVLG